MAYQESDGGEKTVDLVKEILSNFLDNVTNKFEEELGEMKNELGKSVRDIDVNLQKVETVQKEIQSEMNSLKEKQGKTNQELISKYEKLESVVRGLELEVKSLRTKQEQSLPCKCREMLYTVTAAGMQILDDGMDKGGHLLQQAILSSGLEQSVMFDVNLKSSVACNDTEEAEGRIIYPNLKANSTFILKESIQDNNLEKDGDLFATKINLQTNPTNEQGDSTATQTQTSIKNVKSGEDEIKTFQVIPPQKKTYSILEELPLGLREKMQQFYQEKPKRAFNECLLDLQRAYVRYRCGSGETLGPTELANNIILSGIKDKICDSEYTPRKGSNLKRYLTQRIKNERTGKEIEGICKDANAKMNPAAKRQKMANSKV
ncbi:uncharacterized protein LOC132732448 [Ruditapes philippinarum]|uniref:uncharacterized protein LOC132732448 n=1 Tax=Ruditapes philippinarum TaxID=129788 RepID=UPI00295AE894|nr:uncharacterized protein LOC132732448 [Ruditapes philippinarum]